MKKWEKEFNKKFVQDNDPKDGDSLYLFRINNDKTRSLALPDDIKSFIYTHTEDKEFNQIDNLGNKIMGSLIFLFYSLGIATILWGIGQIG